jgi:superfamily II DNA or RNA helicase
LFWGDAFKVDLLSVDEAHARIGRSYRRHLLSLLPAEHILLLSATPLTNRVYRL